MTTNLPNYYFRIRENGAAVFRVDSNNQKQRIEMDQIATINTNRGDFKPHGDRLLSDADEAAISEWLADRLETLARQDHDDIVGTIDHLNRTAHWAQSRATDAQLDDITDQLLLAMHDLRTVLVRKKADRVIGGKKT